MDHLTAYWSQRPRLSTTGPTFEDRIDALITTNLPLAANLAEHRRNALPVVEHSEANRKAVEEIVTKYLWIHHPEWH